MIGLDARQVHSKVKSRFSTMKFEIFGNHALVDLFIRYSICSSAHPAWFPCAELLNSFEKVWNTHKESPEYAQAVENTQLKGTGHKRPTTKIY